MLKSGVVLMMIALLSAGCTTSRPASVAGLRKVVGTDLIGVRGKTVEDQHNINRTAAGICSAKVWTKSECKRHGDVVNAPAQ